MARRIPTFSRSSSLSTGTTRTAWLDRYNSLVDSLLAQPLRADLARLSAIEPSLAGVPQLAGWKAQFDTSYGALRTSPGVQAADAAYVIARERAYTAAFPAWRQQVEAIPREVTAIVGKRRELDGLFPSAADRAGPWFLQFETPLRVKEDELRAGVQAEARRRQESASAPVTANTAAGGGASSSALESSGTSLAVNGLSNSSLVQSIYSGNFAQVDFNRDDMRFHTLYGAYLKAYSDHCGRFLPADRIELTTQECRTESVTRNGYGAELSRVCVAWMTVPTGTFVSPAMYEGHTALMQLVVVDGFREALRLMSQPNPLAAASGIAAVAQAASSDMRALTQTNACVSAPLKRFEENLRLFALNKSAIRLPGDASAVTSISTVVPGLPFRDPNYVRLMQDLVAEQAKTWVMNRFTRVADVSVRSRDAAGRPARLSVSYAYESGGRPARGTIDVKFTDGLPECMYFFDAPSVCRTPNRRIVAAYDSGAYER